MHSRFNKSQTGIDLPNETDAVAALVNVLAGGGISRSKIDAIIMKTARPAAGAATPVAHAARSGAVVWKPAGNLSTKPSER